MYRKQFLPLLLALLILALAACQPAFIPGTSGGTAPAENRPSPEPTVQTPQAFVDQVLGVLAERDPAKIQALMGESFLFGWWRWEMLDEAPADAVRDLLQNNLAPGSSLAAAPDADLVTLMGGKDPASIPGPNVDVVETALVTGWGLEGRDEAILFIARRPDGELYWHGVLVVQGGFTSPQTGGVQLLTNEAHGYSLWYPKGFEVYYPNEQEAVILAPATTEGHRERAFIWVEPAGGKTVEQAVGELLADFEGFEIEQTMTIVGGEAAMILDNLPGQDINRRVLVVHADRLYSMMFVPSDPERAQAYAEMETVFGPLLNTFQFLPLPPAGEQPTGEAVQDLEAFRQRLFQALADRDPAQMQALMGESFIFGYWLSEGVVTSPAEATAQLQQNFLGTETELVFDTGKDLAQLLGGMEPSSVLGPSAPLIQAVFVSGWGLQGQDEAILFISQDEQGRLYWHSVLIAGGGFNSPAAPGGEFPAQETDVQYVMAQKDVSIHSGPGASHPVINQVFSGQTILVTGVSPEGGWWRVICADDTVGDCWVSADPADTQPASSPG